VILASGEAATQPSPLLPHGWIGTTSQWLESFGIGLVVLNVILLALVGHRLRAGPGAPGMWGWPSVSCRSWWGS
jgi:hypothetical protein